MAIAIRVAKGGLASFSCNFSTNGFTLNTSWVLGPGGEHVTEYAVSSGASTWKHTAGVPADRSSSVEWTYAFASGKLLASCHDTDTYFALNDGLGNRRA